MNFTNSLVSPEELPGIKQINFQPLEIDYLLVERISLLFFMIVLLGIGGSSFYFVEGLREPFLLSVAVLIYVLLFVFRLIAIKINYKYSGYALREKDVLFRNGWLKRKTRVVLLNRIQHVSVQSGPLERKFGLSSVSIFTAGSAEADFTIHGISETTAHQIKEYISAEPNQDGEL